MGEGGDSIKIDFMEINNEYFERDESVPESFALAVFCDNIYDASFSTTKDIPS